MFTQQPPASTREGCLQTISLVILRTYLCGLIAGSENTLATPKGPLAQLVNLLENNSGSGAAAQQSVPAPEEPV